MRTLVPFQAKDLRNSDHTPPRDPDARGEKRHISIIDPYGFAPKRIRGIPYPPIASPVLFRGGKH